MYTVEQAFIATLIAAFVTYFTRFAPFVFLSRGADKQNPTLSYVQKYIPPMTMAILVIYSVKDVNWVEAPFGLPAIAGIALTFALHLWRNNPLISIFGGTALYMFLIRVL